MAGQTLIGLKPKEQRKLICNKGDLKLNHHFNLNRQYPFFKSATGRQIKPKYSLVPIRDMSKLGTFSVVLVVMDSKRTNFPSLEWVCSCFTV